MHFKHKTECAHALLRKKMVFEPGYCFRVTLSEFFFGIRNISELVGDMNFLNALSEEIFSGENVHSLQRYGFV